MHCFEFTDDELIDLRISVSTAVERLASTLDRIEETGHSIPADLRAKFDRVLLLSQRLSYGD